MIVAIEKNASPERWEEILTAVLKDDALRLKVRAIWVSPAIEDRLWKDGVKKLKSLKERVEDEKSRKVWECENGGIAARYVFWGVPVFPSQIFVLEDEEEDFALVC